MNKNIHIISVFLLPALFVSCLTSPQKKEEKKTVEKVEVKPVQGPKVILDKQAESNIQVQKVHSEFLPTGLIKAVISLKNTSDKPFKFSYKFIWLDKKELPVKLPAETWKEKVIMSGDIAELSAIAPNPGCRSFKLKLTTLE